MQQTSTLGKVAVTIPLRQPVEQGKNPLASQQARGGHPFSHLGAFLEGPLLRARRGHCPRAGMGIGLAAAELRPSGIRQRRTIKGWKACFVVGSRRILRGFERRAA